MRRFLFSIFPAIALLLFAGCSDSASGVWDDMPASISRFIAEYFPDTGVDKFIVDDNNYYVTLHNSASIVFDANQAWLSVDGNGQTLPPVLLFDELPPALYAYLQDTDAVDAVYKIARNAATYTVGLTDSSLTYTISSGLISSPE